MANTSLARSGEETNGRVERGRELYAEHAAEFEHVGDHTWLVPSSDGERRYRVVYGGIVEERCGCDDFYYRGSPCKHLVAVALLHAKRRARRGL